MKHWSRQQRKERSYKFTYLTFLTVIGKELQLNRMLVVYKLSEGIFKRNILLKTAQIPWSSSSPNFQFYIILMKTVSFVLL